MIFNIHSAGAGTFLPCELMNDSGRGERGQRNQEIGERKAERGKRNQEIGDRKAERGKRFHPG